MSDRTQRVRDPIHGLIVFNEHDATDMLAWRLIQTSEFQRLRRIKQLGVSEFVFPGATHTRLAHSIGVYHNARKLMKVIEEGEGKNFSPERAQVILLAALMHDLGHGPFSHAFEGARKTLAIGRKKIETFEKHEKFTAKMILDDEGEIKPILDSVRNGMAAEIAALFDVDDPTDIYHAVLSSSFDADRLDYLMRDRYMTGTKAGAIDYDWLMDNLTTYEITVHQDGDDAHYRVPTFVFKSKGRQAAEDFLLARYRLYTQVYLHKTTRGFECLLSALIQGMGEMADKPHLLGLNADHPLIKFLHTDGETISNYRNLDDTAVWSAAERIRFCNEKSLSVLAQRVWERNAPKVLDVSADLGHNPDAEHNALRRLAGHTQSSLGKTCFRDDEASYNLYSRSNGEMTKAHKVVRVCTADGDCREITKFADTVISENLTNKTRLVRYYFLSDEDRNAAEKIMKGA